ncbi:MAG: hypothetical protein P1U56_26855 [Saprospiraceae bacterium]|nr:hypothetical protein [Saprospiraceae bacterium]
MEITEFITHQRDLLSADKVFQCIEDLFVVFSRDRSVENSLILLLSQYNKFLNEWRGGLQTREESNVELNRIKKRLLSFLDELDVNGKSIYYELPHLFLETNFEEISVDERVLWRYIDRMGKDDGYKYYLSEYPNGFYIHKAKLLLSEILPTTIPKNRTKVTFRVDNNHLIHHEFYQNEKFTSTDFLNSITTLAQSVFNVKIKSYGKEWILREYYTSQTVDEINDQTFEFYLGKEYEVVLLDKEHLKLSTNVMIDSNNLAYESLIRENALLVLDDSTPLKKQIKEEIKEIRIINKSAQEKRSNVCPRISNKFIGLWKNKIFLTKCIFNSLLILYILFKIGFQYFNGHITAYPDRPIYISIFVLVVVIIDFVFLYYLIDLAFYEHLKTVSRGYLLSLITSLITSIYVFNDWSSVEKDSDVLFVILDNGALLFVYLAPLFIFGVISKYIVDE